MSGRKARILRKFCVRTRSPQRRLSQWYMHLSHHDKGVASRFWLDCLAGRIKIEDVQ